MYENLSYIDVRDLLESTGVKNLSESSGQISFSCPGPDHFHGDHSPSARMNARTTAWLCFGCGQRGNAITFLAWHKGLSETVARRMLEERYGGGGITAGVGTLEDMVISIMNPTVVEEEVRIPPSESWLRTFYDGMRGFEPAQEYMASRGFGQQISEEWRIGYDYLSDRVTIPVFNHEGNLVGFKGRAWRENTIPKYMIMGDYGTQQRYGFQPYQKSKYVFGLNIIRNHYNSDVVIVEGELNAIAMHQRDYSALGIAGSEFSQTQCDLIKMYCDSVILYLDNDKAGEKGTKKVIDMLSPYMPIKVVQNAPGDAAELDRDTIRELISSAQSVLELQVTGKLI